jgi:hypothetical protein
MIRSMRKSLVSLLGPLATTAFITLIAAIALSYWQPYELFRMRTEALEQYSFGRGRVAYLWFPSLAEVRPPFPPPPAWTFRPLNLSGPFVGVQGGLLPTTTRFAGLEWAWPILVVVPLWMPATVALVPAGWWWSRLWRQYRRRSVGVCSACGYDLRATPERCPECGAVAEPANTPKISLD